MALDTSSVLVGIITPMITTGGIVLVAWIRRRPSKLEDAKQDAETNQTQFQQNLDLAKYVDKRIADATADLRKDVDDLKRALGWMHRWAQRIRLAIVEYMHDVETNWPTQSTAAPPRSDHIRQLLDEENVDDNTASGDVVRRIAEDVRANRPRA